MAPKRKNAPLCNDAATNLRIDAITAEALHPKKFVTITSPDKTLVLYYNTDTLIRIGLEKGQMLQPPHFREPIKAELLAEIEELEGKKIVLETVTSKSVRQAAHGDDDEHAVTEIVHRHAFFEQMINEIYLLSPAELYVCPACFQHWHQLRNQEQEEELRRAAASSRRETTDVEELLTERQLAILRLKDPLDLLEALDPETQLPFVVFRFAKHWKTHVKTYHGFTDHSATEHRLRDVLCTYYSDYNGIVGRAKGHTLTQQRYWAMNARFNTVRYNRMVERLEEVASNVDQTAASRCAFADVPNEFVDDPTVDTKGTSKGGGRKRGRAEESDTWLVDDDVASDSSYDEDSSVSSTSGSCSDSPSDDSSDAPSSERNTKRSSYLKPHHPSDRLTYEERQFVQQQLQKEERKQCRSFPKSQVRRPTRLVQREKNLFWRRQDEDSSEASSSDEEEFGSLDFSNLDGLPLSELAKMKKTKDESAASSTILPSDCTNEDDDIRAIVGTAEADKSVPSLAQSVNVRPVLIDEDE